MESIIRISQNFENSQNSYGYGDGYGDGYGNGYGDGNGF